MLIEINILLFKKIIILFWALWWMIALWTDLVGLLAHLNLIHAQWAPDTNFPFLLNSVSMYSVPLLISQILFYGIILWSSISTFSFIWACFALHKNEKQWMNRAQVAFIISITFWFAFFIADQLVMKFDLEENHMVQGGFELMTFLALYLLPNKY